MQHKGERVPEHVRSWTPGLAREARRPRPGGMSLTEDERALLEQRNRLGLTGPDADVQVSRRLAVPERVPVRTPFIGVTGWTDGPRLVGLDREPDEVAALEDAALIIGAPLPFPSLGEAQHLSHDLSAWDA